MDKVKQDSKQVAVQNAWEQVAGSNPFQINNLNGVQVQTSAFTAFSNDSFPSLVEVRTPDQLNGIGIQSRSGSAKHTGAQASLERSGMSISQDAASKLKLAF